LLTRYHLDLNHPDFIAGPSPPLQKLRDVTEDDLLVFFEHQLDPDATHMAAFSARDRNTFLMHWTRVLGNEAIIKKTILFNERVAGNIVCFEHSGKREVGYWIGKEFWGKGIATQALSQFLSLVKVRPLYAGVVKHNVASIRVLEKCGFAACGQEGEELILMLS